MYRDRVALHYGQDEFRDGAALARTLGRERLKDTSLEYDGPLDGRVPDGAERGATAYAERRGFDPLRPASEIVVQRPAASRVERQQERPAEPVRDLRRKQAVAAGRAWFRERLRGAPAPAGPGAERGGSA